MLRISIVTPSFNQARYIRATLESVQSQRGDFELEHIVVDGGSQDETCDILREYDGRLQWTSERDEGQSDALNKGLARATGDIIGWLNSDDLYEPGCLATVAQVFESEPETRWLYGRVKIIDPEGREIRRWITAYKNWRMRRFSLRRLLAENWISQMGVFWRRSAGEEVGPFRRDLHYAMDYDYWLRLATRWPGRFVDRYLGAFRWYPQSKSGSQFGTQFREAFEVAKRHAGPHRWPLVCHQLHRFQTVTAYRLLQYAPFAGR